jgi:glutathione S-transferase
VTAASHRTGPGAAPWRYYGCENSYFSAKVRPALRYKGLHFAELLPTPAAYRDVIRPRTGGLAYIPILVTPEGDTWQDTSEILDALERRVPEPPLYPPTPAQRVAAHLLELYADEFLLLPAMHWRWSTAEGRAAARADFAAVSGESESSRRLAERMQGSLTLLGVAPETIPAIEAHGLALFDALSAHFTEHAFLLGGRPSFADCALMGPLYAHLRLDPVPARILRDRALPLLQWIERMNRPDPDAAGAWLSGDALAPTLRPVLELIGRDAAPVLRDGLAAFGAWAAAQPAGDAVLPRGVGLHATTLRGAAMQRYTSPYLQWMAQRAHDAYAELSTPERAVVDAALAGTGCATLLRPIGNRRVAKRSFQLVFAA